MNDFYKYFGLSNASNEFKQKQEINQLFRIPKKEPKELMPHFINFKTNDTHQCDILYLPNDNGFKYALVVVDIATNKCDVVALKVLDSYTVLKAILTIYERGILKLPTTLITDSGSEFKGEFAKYFKTKVFMKKTLAGRSRQNALVERKNQILGTVLHMGMLSKELLTGELNREWVDNLNDIVKKMNDRYGHIPYTDDELDKKYGDPFLIKQDIIPLGTHVRVALDQPRDITGEKLHGKFRSSDTRWTNEIYKIINFTLNPHSPVMYEIDKPTKENEYVYYTAQRLQIVKDSQSPPISILKNPTTYMIDKILKKKISKGKPYYFIKWKGFGDANTWEPEENINKKLIQEFQLK